VASGKHPGGHPVEGCVQNRILGSDELVVEMARRPAPLQAFR